MLKRVAISLKEEEKGGKRMRKVEKSENKLRKVKKSATKWTS